jgi:hypothetical protein
MFSPKKLVEHLAHRAFEKRHPARMARAVPGIRAVLRVFDQLAKKRRGQAGDIASGFADDVARHEFGRVLEHMDEAVQLAQNVVGDVFGGARFAVQINRDVGVAETHFADEGAQVLDGAGRLRGRGVVEFLVVDRQNEGAGAALLLGEGTQVAVTGDADHFHALGLDGRGQGAYAQPRSVFGTEIFVDDEDGETEFHAGLREGGRACTPAAEPRAENGREFTAGTRSA